MKSNKSNTAEIQQIPTRRSPVRGVRLDCCSCAAKRLEDGVGEEKAIGSKTLQRRAGRRRAGSATAGASGRARVDPPLGHSRRPWLAAGSVAQPPAGRAPRGVDVTYRSSWKGLICGEATPALGTWARRRKHVGEDGRPRRAAERSPTPRRSSPGWPLARTRA
jgi:hypothetical protein